MAELAVGDKVMAVSSTGKLVYDDVYFFGHADHKLEGDYLSIYVGAGAEPIVMSFSHFLPICQSEPCRWGDRLEIYAEKVKVGDQVWVNSPAGLEIKSVSSITTSVQKGAFNPYTLLGSIVVDGVVASAHSEWIFDPLMSEVWQHWLPALYQAMFFPGRMLYRIAGAWAADALDMNNPQRSPDTFGHGPKFLVAVGLFLSGVALEAWRCFPAISDHPAQNFAGSCQATKVTP